MTVPPLEIRRLETTVEADHFARLMSGMDPWMTLDRTYDHARAAVTNPAREVYVCATDSELCGCLILCMVGALVGYIQTILIAPEHQGKGFGTRLMAFAEDRIFLESENAFIMVSSFNPDARRLYERLGYAYIGDLVDYLAPGYSELLFRKTRSQRRRHASET